LTHWSFEQLAGLASAPPAYLRTLPAPIAADAINYGLQRADRGQHQLFADRDEPWTVHAITSPRYARVHHDELADRVLDLMAQHPAWHLPLGYKDGVMGAERVPSGAYLGDRDMFLFLVDGNRISTTPPTVRRPGCSAASCSGTATSAPPPSPSTCSCFAPAARTTCSGVSPRGRLPAPARGASIHDAWADSLRAVRVALDADLATDRAILLRATSQELGATREEVIDAAVQRLDLSRSTPSTPTRWRNSTRRTRDPSGATCRD
jgi:hypothetical protein